MGLGQSLAENLPNTDPEVSGQTASSYPVNQPGKPMLRPAGRLPFRRLWGRVWPEINRLQDECCRRVWDKAYVRTYVAENLPNTDPEISGQIAFSYVRSYRTQ